MTTTTTITLDIARSGSPPVVYAKQGDCGTRFVKCNLTENGTAYTIESGLTARIRVLKPDDTAVYNDATISGNSVTAELTKQALAVCGTAVAEIGLYKGSALLSTFLFYIEIERNAVSDKQIESSDEFRTLDEALNEAANAVSIANTAATKANTAATNADTARTNLTTTVNNTVAAANSAVNTAVTNANTATTRANAAAEAVGEAIDGIAVKDTTNNKTYVVKFRLVNGKPVAEYDEL